MALKTIKIGTRGSPLAMAQSGWVEQRLARLHPRYTFELVIIKTTGDRIQDRPLQALGGKGLFVKEIEEALLEGRIDLAVHSMKDLPGDLPEGLTVGAVPEREDPRDVFVSADGRSLKEVTPGCRIGTGSLRRKVQLLKYRPDLEVIPLRGNLETRLKKIKKEGLAGVILAAAGMHRLGFGERITEYLGPQIILPAVGQGALALEVREEDREVEELIRAIHHEPTALCTRVERAFLRRLQGGCQVPIAGYACLSEGKLHFQGMVAAMDSPLILTERIAGDLKDPEGLGAAAADRLLRKGAREILKGKDGGGID